MVFASYSCGRFVSFDYSITTDVRLAIGHVPLICLAFGEAFTVVKWFLLRAPVAGSSH